MSVRMFWCAFYFDPSAEDFILHAVYSDEKQAADSLKDLPTVLTNRVVTQWTMEGLKRYFVGEQAPEGEQRALYTIGKPFPVAVAPL